MQDNKIDSTTDKKNYSSQKSIKSFFLTLFLKQNPFLSGGTEKSFLKIENTRQGTGILAPPNSPFNTDIPVGLQDARLGAEVTRDLNVLNLKNLKEYPGYFEGFSGSEHSKVDVRSDAQSRILKSDGYRSDDPLHTPFSSHNQNKARSLHQIEISLIRQPSTIPYFLIQHNLPSDAMAARILVKLAQEYQISLPEIMQIIGESSDPSFSLLLSYKHAKKISDYLDEDDEWMQEITTNELSIDCQSDDEWNNDDTLLRISNKFEKMQLENQYLELRLEQVLLENKEIRELLNYSEQKNQFLNEQKNALKQQIENSQMVETTHKTLDLLEKEATKNKALLESLNKKENELENLREETEEIKQQHAEERKLREKAESELETANQKNKALTEKIAKLQKINTTLKDIQDRHTKIIEKLQRENAQKNADCVYIPENTFPVQPTLRPQIDANSLETARNNLKPTQNNVSNSLVSNPQIEQEKQITIEVLQTQQHALKKNLSEQEKKQESQPEENNASKEQVLQENEALKQDVESKKMEIQEQNKTIKNLGTELAQAKQSVDNLQKTHDSLVAEHETLKQANAELAAEKVAKEQEQKGMHQKLEQELAQLQQANTQLAIKNQTLKQDKQQAIDQQETQKETNATLTQANTQLQLQLDNKDRQINELTYKNLVSSIVAGLATAEEISNANLTANQVLAILQQLGQATPEQSLTGELLTFRKRQAVVVIQNSIERFDLDQVLQFKTLIDAKKQEDTVHSAYSFIRQEQDFFRCRYGNTKTWETIMGLVKNKLSECLAAAQADTLTEDQKNNATAIFQTHRQHGYGFGFFSTPKIPPSVKNKLTLVHSIMPK